MNMVWCHVEIGVYLFILDSSHFGVYLFFSIYVTIVLFIGI